MATRNSGDVTAHWIRYHARQYRRTGNPVFVWEAIGEALAAGRALPAWTRAYLATVAAALRPLSRDRIPKADGIAAAVARAFRFTGKGRENVFRELARPGHELVVAMHVYEHYTRHRHYSWDDIFADVAATHHRRCGTCTRPLSAGTVKRYWHRHALTVIPPHLVNRSKAQKVGDILR